MRGGWRHSVTHPPCDQGACSHRPCGAGQCREADAYWPVLGLVLGPGEVLGVGLVVLGVSVPMPPADEPEDDPPDMSFDPPVDVPDELPDDVPPDVPPEVPPVGTPLDGFEGMPSIGVPPELLVPELLVPELPLMPEPEPPPVMPVHAPSSITQAMGNIHFVISHSRKFQMAVRTVARTERTALLMQRVEAGGE